MCTDCAAAMFHYMSYSLSCCSFNSRVFSIQSCLVDSRILFSLNSFVTSPRFQVNLEYLESKLESVDGEEVQRIQDNINSLFHHCVQALGEEHQIKVVNALQVTTGAHIRSLLIMLMKL